MPLNELMKASSNKKSTSIKIYLNKNLRPICFDHASRSERMLATRTKIALAKSLLCVELE